jgi:dTDP-4-amino-4,6-dideoxygalactose transaminase
MNIQMVDLVGQYNKIKGEVDKAISDVITKGAFINGPAVSELKAKMEKKFEVKHVIPCGNGTDALQIALMALDLQPGDEVITTPFTFIATAEVISLLKLKPVFVDIDKESYNIDASKIEEKITAKTKAIIPVHLYGQCAEMELILEIAKKHNLFVVEDTAQGINSKYTFSNGVSKYAGTMGDIGTTSFFPSKNLGGFGDGGALLTNSDELAHRLKMITNHGSEKKYYHSIVGVNSRLDTLQAAILNVKIDYLDEYCSARNEVAKYYLDSLGIIPGLILPKISKKSTHVFHQFTIRVLNGKREELKAYLEEEGIPSMVYYPLCLHQQDAFAHEHDGSIMFVSEGYQNEVLSLPMHTELDSSQLEYICSKIKAFFK